MSYDVDFKQVAATPILDVLNMLGINGLKEVQADIRGQKVQQFVGPCPISKQTNATAFKITPSLNRFACFCSACKQREKQGGDCIELVRRVRDVDYRKAAIEIRTHFSAGKATENAQPQQEVEPSRNSAAFDPLGYVKTLAVEHEALSELGIAPETLITFQAGYSSKGLNRGRLAVAWHDMEGSVLAFIGIALKGEVPHYLMPKGQFVPYWFNNWRVDEGAQVQIVPSILHVMEAYENGESNVLCPLRPIDGDALNCLLALARAKNLTIEF